MRLSIKSTQGNYLPRLNLEFGGKIPQGGVAFFPGDRPFATSPSPGMYPEKDHPHALACGLLFICPRAIFHLTVDELLIIQLDVPSYDVARSAEKWCLIARYDAQQVRRKDKQEPMVKRFHIIRYLFLAMYLLYAVSPLLVTSDNTPLVGTITARSSITFRLLIVDRLLDFLFEGGYDGGKEETGQSDDFLVRKFRCLPGGNSLGKKIFSESHYSVPPHIMHDSYCSGMEQRSFAHPVTNASVPAARDGYGSHYSGLSPPVSFS